MPIPLHIWVWLETVFESLSEYPQLHMTNMCPICQLADIISCQCRFETLYIVTHDSALHVGMAPKKMAVPINVLAVIRR